MMMERGEGVSKVAREKLVACMTCPLCDKLFKDATSISECLHTFCRKCIYEKITEEELDSCPVCNIDLGCAPLEKLRADNNWREIRIKIFPPKRQKPKESEKMSLVPLPARRKERSLSSLVVSTPRVSAKSCLTGRRSKLTARKTIASQEPSLLNEEHVSKLEGLLSSPETYSKIAQNSRQNFNVGESSKQHALDRSTAEALEEKGDLWKPLNHLVEAASKTKPNKVNSQGSIAKPAPHAPGNEVNLLNVKECGTGSNIPSKENDSTPEPSTSARPRRSRGIRQKREAVSERLNIPVQAVVDSSNKYDGRFSPTWFSLVASKNQEGDAPLPQISSCYLRVKDGNLPVSSIKKYLARKLGLSSETEVEISLRGHPVLSTLQLHNLVDWWVQTTPASERIQAFVGSSAKDFVMVLSYSRNARPP
ncbi:E3 ubiquitin protein ligase DRIP2-like [Herrania umbratica]|uniref:E3 ubiquitin protein ligase DRIP2-like n=1 Tax=Herrania umbratica TaxID=108875 RepID=A0A6J1AVB6_9ROSI|nr:E3 ubiquitin protein ligase DRIP2-like [Herrania umbratica]